MPPNTPHSNRPRSPIPVHPPFPSFGWVMNSQANPPSDAYAHGYVQNALTHSRALTQRQTRFCASCTNHRESYQRTTKPYLPPPPAEVSPITTHEVFMVSKKSCFSSKHKALTDGWPFSKRSTTATTICQRGRLSRGERASRRMRCRDFAFAPRCPYQPHLPPVLVRRGGVLTYVV